MSFPKMESGDFERIQWEMICDKLGDKINGVTSLDELRVALSEDGEIKEEEYNIGCMIVGKKYILINKKGFESPVAYMCGSCDGVFIGPPKIENYNDFEKEDHSPLSGAKGYRVSCKDCGCLLDNVVEVVS